MLRIFRKRIYSILHDATHPGFKITRVMLISHYFWYEIHKYVDKTGELIVSNGGISPDKNSSFMQIPEFERIEKFRAL